MARQSGYDRHITIFSPEAGTFVLAPNFDSKGFHSEPKERDQAEVSLLSVLKTDGFRWFQLGFDHLAVGPCCLRSMTSRLSFSMVDLRECR